MITINVFSMKLIPFQHLHFNKKRCTNVLDHGTGVGRDGGGGHHGERADGDEDQEQLEEDHLGAG